MEGVGARLGRTSTRYGPTTVFTGPVRKWKKKWVHVSPSSASANHNNNTTNNNASHLLLYKWSPITSSSSSNNNNGDKKDDDSSSSATEAPPRKKFKYVPIAVLEEERKEEMEEVDEEAKPSETDPSEGPTPKSDGTDGKPDINDVPMEEAQDPDKDQSVQQDLNETSLDLSLGIKGHEGDHDSDPKLESPSKG